METKTQLQRIREFDRNNNSILAVAREVLDGNINALPVLEYLRKVKLVAEEAEDMIKGQAMDELYEYSLTERKKGIMIGEAIFCTKASPSKWVYEDPLIKDHETKSKERLKYLQGKAQQSMKNKTSNLPNEYDVETGAEIQPAVQIIGQEILTVSFKSKG